MQTENTTNEQKELDAPEITLPLSDIEEITLSAMKDIYNDFQDELYTIEEEAKKQEVHGGN